MSVLNLDSDRHPQTSCLPLVARQVSELRRPLIRDDFGYFPKLYLGRHMSAPPSRMHREVTAWLTDATTRRKQRIAIAAPRGHAKTTLVSLAYILWSALTAKEKLILLLSATSEQAQQLLRDIRRELLENDLLRADFPEVCEPIAKAPSPQAVVKQNRIELPNGSCIRVLGAGQGLRGMKHGDQRPTLIVADDLENLEGVESEEQREKLWEWFMGTVLKAGQPNTNVVLIGTVLHHDSLLGRLTDERQATGGWRSKRYRAVQSEAAAAALWDEWRLIRSGESMFEGDSGDEAADAYFQAHQAEMLRGAEVLWPQRESYLDLMKMKQDEGEASFQAEKQNEPIDPATCLFANARFRYWDRPAASGDIGVYSDVDDLHRALGNRAHFVMACDPSLGTRRGEGDYGAVVVVIRDDRSDSGDEIYVVHAMIERRTPTEMIEHMVELGKVYPIDEVVIESNQFQAIMADELEQRLTSTGTYCQVNRVNNRSNKRTRILGLEPLVASGRLRFCSQHERLIQQLRDFPLARHDDGPDALEMAVNAANGPKHYSYSFQI